MFYKKIVLLLFATSFSSVFAGQKARENPFVPVKIHVAAAPSILPVRHHEKQVLENYPLNQLDYVGRLTQKGRKWGLVKDKFGEVHPVRIGDFIGEKQGKVVAIDARNIALVELIRVPGAYTKRVAFLSMKNAEEA